MIDVRNAKLAKDYRVGTVLEASAEWIGTCFLKPMSLCTIKLNKLVIIASRQADKGGDGEGDEDGDEEEEQNSRDSSSAGEDNAPLQKPQKVTPKRKNASTLLSLRISNSPDLNENHLANCL